MHYARELVKKASSLYQKASNFVSPPFENTPLSRDEYITVIDEVFPGYQHIPPDAQDLLFKEALFKRKLQALDPPMTTPQFKQFVETYRNTPIETNLQTHIQGYQTKQYTELRTWIATIPEDSAKASIDATYLDALEIVRNNPALSPFQTTYKEKVQTLATKLLSFKPLPKPFLDYQKIWLKLRQSRYVTPLYKLYTLVYHFASTHAFIQWLGFSTQNEASGMAWLDIFNYFAHQKNITQTKAILVRFLSSFTTLHLEYLEITTLKHNPFHFAWRFLLPLCLFVACLSALLLGATLLGLPELALCFVAIPALIVSLYSTNAFIWLKNKLWHQLRVLFYGGESQLPEYQPNKRMRSLFEEPTLLSEIHAFYMHQLKTYKQLVQHPSYDKTEKVLTKNEQKQLEAHRETLGQLTLEWATLHDDEELSKEDGIALVKARLATRYNTLQEKLSLEHTPLVNNLMQHEKVPPTAEVYKPLWAHRHEACKLLSITQRMSATSATSA